MIAVNKVGLFVYIGLLCCLTEVRAQDRVHYGRNHAQPGTTYIIDTASFNRKPACFRAALYDSDGMLIANQIVKLSASELALWNKAKDSLMAIAYRKLSYHPLFADNGIQFKIIFEFVFKPGKPVTYRIYQSSIKLNDNQSKIILEANGNMFRSWYTFFKKTARTKDAVKFYLPVKYEVPSTAAAHHYAPAADSVYINNGWMVLRAGTVVESSQR